jgi:hypothetical protein
VNRPSAFGVSLSKPSFARAARELPGSDPRRNPGPLPVSVRCLPRDQGNSPSELAGAPPIATSAVHIFADKHAKFTAFIFKSDVESGKLLTY